MIHPDLPVSGLQAWAILNDAELPTAKIVTDILDKNGLSKGGGLVATRDASAGEILLKVPRDLVVARERVEEYAKTDTNFRDVLVAVEGFAKVGHGHSMEPTVGAC
jgi:hypothetical protein